MDGNHGCGYRLFVFRGNIVRKKFFRRIYSDDYIPDDELLHIFFDFSMIRLDITAYDSTLSKTYAKFFDAYSQAKLKNVFPKDLASFIDSFLVDPHNFDINTCNPFNTTDDRYYFNYEGDEAYTYIWLNVSLNFSRGDIFMDEKTNPTVGSQLTANDGHIETAQSTDNQESALDTVTDTSSADYVKAKGDQPVLDSSSGLPLWEKDLAEEDDFFRYMQEDEKLKTYQMDMSDTSTTSGIAVVPAIIDEAPVTSTEENLSTMNLDSLTVEIKQYFNVARYSVIEVGKRLILAKELVPHGKWASWLKDNFNLKRQMAQNFMNIAERFGKNDSDAYYQSIGNIDISAFKPTQLIALLALPKGKEKMFIETKAAEGTPVADMSVKKLRSDIKKYIANSTHDESVSNFSLLAPASVPDTEISSQETSTLIRYTSSSQQTDITYSSTPAQDVDETLAQLFAAASSLRNADNLQRVVTAYAEKDLTTFEQHLSQLAATYSELNNYLTIWKSNVHNNINEDT